MDEHFEEENEYSSHYYDIVHSRTQYVNRNRREKRGRRDRRGNRSNIGTSYITYTYQTPNIIPSLFISSMREHIINNYKFLAQNDLGPKIFNVMILEDHFSITVEYGNDICDAEDIAFRIGDTVAKLHRLGKGHGNLCRSNIIVGESKVHFLSPEYIYDIDSLEEDLNIHFYAFNKYDIDLEDDEERDRYLNLDYELWGEDMYGSYRCRQRHVADSRMGQVTLLIM